jgi:hypothetical protein
MIFAREGWHQGEHGTGISSCVREGQRGSCRLRAGERNSSIATLRQQRKKIKVLKHIQEKNNALLLGQGIMSVTSC